MAYLDPAKKRAAERAYRKKNKEKVLAYESRFRKEMKAFKQELLNQFNCLLCGECDSDLIDWHHVDPSQKRYVVSDWFLSHNAWWNEVLKCIPLCALCHRKIHTNKLCLLPINHTGSKLQQVTESIYVRDFTCHR